MALCCLLAVVAAAALALADGGGRSPLGPAPASRPLSPPSGAPLRYSAARAAAFSKRAAQGEAQALYVASPGGALATAARVARWGGAIQRAVAGTKIPASLLEALVFVESAGRPDALAGSSVAGAAGLTQIVAATGTSMLGMHIDLAASAALSARIAAAQAAGDSARVAALARARALADPRFDPEAALAATVGYLQLARARFGRLDLAIESYHMGIANLQHVLDLYDGGVPVPYAQLYFDTAPDRHGAAWRALHGFLDDSDLYWWRVLGAERIMRLYAHDRPALRREAELESSYPSDGLLLVWRARQFADPRALSAAYRAGVLVPLPSDPARLGLAWGSRLGAGADRGVPRSLYLGLRPAALEVLALIGTQVQALSRSHAPLMLAGAVVDVAQQRRTGVLDPPAATGYTFSLQRRYASAAQALALQAVLDRLQALDLIGWFRTPATIQVTVAPDAGAVLAHGP